MKRTFATMIPAGVGTIAICLLILASACGSGGTEMGTPTGPSVVPSPTPPSSPVPPQGGRQISVGEEVTGTLEGHGAGQLYELTAPSDGTLMGRLIWDPHQGVLELRLADTQFFASPSYGSPIVGELSVAAGRTYSVKIADGAPWDYDDLSLSFVVTTSIE